MRNNGHDGDSGFTFELHAVSIVHEVAIYLLFIFFPEVVTFLVYMTSLQVVSCWRSIMNEEKTRCRE